MLMTPNYDPFTSRYIKEGWASYGFDYLDTFDKDSEDRQPFGFKNAFNYTKPGSFYSLGGYVRKLDLKNHTRDTSL
jgi:hypothetical protein